MLQEKINTDLPIAALSHGGLPKHRRTLNIGCHTVWHLNVMADQDGRCGLLQCRSFLWRKKFVEYGMQGWRVVVHGGCEI